MGSGGGRKVTGVSPSYLSIKSLFEEYFLISLRMHFGKRVIYKQMSIDQWLCEFAHQGFYVPEKKNYVIFLCSVSITALQ